MTHFSLCTGIGGIDLAAEWAGFTTIGQCEIDDYASRVLEKNFKGVPNFHDIRTVTAARLRESGIDPADITVLSAGFPCQPYSLAGKGRGDGDERDLGEKLQDVSASLSRSGSSVRIRPVCLPELTKGTSNEYLPTLPKWGTECRGEYGELATSGRLTSESGCSFALLTPTASDGLRSEFKLESLAKRYIKHPNVNLAEQVGYMEMFPTPTVCGNYNKKGTSKTSGNGLATVVKMFPTPLASERKHGKGKQHGLSDELGTGKLNPTWVEWLMGFPTDWTDLDV